MMGSIAPEGAHQPYTEQAARAGTREEFNHHLSVFGR